MNIHSATQGSVAPSPTAKLQIPSDTVITPMPLRAPEPPRVGPIPPNDAERMTQAFQNVIDELNQQKVVVQVYSLTLEVFHTYFVL